MAESWLRLIGKIGHVTLEILSNILPNKGQIFMLHDIGEEDGDFILTPNQFENFLVIHKKDNFIRLENLSQSHNFIALTIDDVPEGFYKYGFPLLKKYNIPFTIFVNIALINKPGYLNSLQLTELAKNKLCTIGSHGTVHQFYKNLSKIEKRSFLKDSKDELSAICNVPIDLFAFPYGSYYACGYKDKKLVLKYYKYGFGTVNSAITRPSLFHKYFIPRRNLTSQFICGQKK